ncbi:recombinase family protein [Bradyrhizobium sp. 190]|uniref:recombinase family protein n=1 Tax=Bradyrhizobium sp. 190 TaxID=2782658 RepID=UPI001FF9D955|nr:recombinase family protein [Bradyrhizobium sp. 190]MCK1511372.1 recombinase family protein [Bradyrhizobium sp. 190]
MAKSVDKQQKVVRYISYLRVSRESQGLHGLGIEAQRRAVREYLARVGAADALLAEYVEVESGRRNERPELLRSFDHARNARATLIIAKLDRLSRDVHFLTGLERAGIEFIACDLPNANRLTITILAAVAEHEREMTAERTRAALAVARDRVAKVGQRGRPSVKRLGNPNGAEHLKELGNRAAVSALKARADDTARRLSNSLHAVIESGAKSSRAIAVALNERGVLSPRGSQWDAKAVINLQRRLAAMGQQNT